MYLKKFLTNLSSNKRLSIPEKNALLKQFLVDKKIELGKAANTSKIYHEALIGSEAVRAELLMHKNQDITALYIGLLEHALADGYINPLVVKETFDEALHRSLHPKSPAHVFDLCIKFLHKMSHFNFMPAKAYQELMLDDVHPTNTLLQRFIQVGNKARVPEFKHYLAILDELYINKHLTTEQYTAVLEQQLIKKMVNFADAGITLTFLEWFGKNTLQLPPEKLYGLLFKNNGKAIRCYDKKPGARLINDELARIASEFNPELINQTINEIVAMDEGKLHQLMEEEGLSGKYRTKYRFFRSVDVDESSTPDSLDYTGSPECVSGV